MISRDTLCERIGSGLLRETRDISLRLVFICISTGITLVIVVSSSFLLKISRGEVVIQFSHFLEIFGITCSIIIFITLLFLFFTRCAPRTVSLWPATSVVRSVGSFRVPSSRLHLALMDRDFDADDYEMLQQLDEGIVNPNQGATEGELRRLPIHFISQNDLASTSYVCKSCPICLANFEVNDEVKSLLCLHRFHQSCVDKWLREKAICPVCKFPAVNFELENYV